MDNVEKNAIVYYSDYVPDTSLERFQKIIERKYNVEFESYKYFHKWTVENYTKFWEELWHFLDVISSEPYTEVLVKTGPGFLDNKWFSGAKLNYAENVLRIRDDRVALLSLDEIGNEETVTFAQMFEEVKLYASAFRKNGLEIGDSVACFMSNRKEAIFALLAVASIGAMWGGPLPFYGAQAASTIIKEMDPKFLITVDSHLFDGDNYPILDNLPQIVDNAPTIKKVILVITKKETMKKDISNFRNCVILEDFLAEGRTRDGKVPDIVFEQLPFDHPLNINFTSGTTGLPKSIIHSAGTFMTLLRDYAMAYNTKCGDLVALNYPVGWSAWDEVIPCLALGAKLFLACFWMDYDHNGKNYWDIMAKYNVNFTILVSSMIDNMEKTGIQPSPDSNLDCLKMIGIVGSAVKRNSFEYIQKKVKKDVYIVNMYSSTEIFGSISGFNLNMPVYAGEIQVPSLGVNIRCFDSEGKSVTGLRGELVLCTPEPGFPVGLWKDDDKSLTDIYLKKYPGVWAQHDECWINPKRDGFIVTGRSDDTLKQNSARFMSGDIYTAVHALEELQDYICVGQRNYDGDSRAILFVKMQEGYRMTPEIRAKIAKAIEEQLWIIYVPELILEVPDIPYNLNNKRMESLVRKIVQTNTIPEVMNIKNPESLKPFLNIPEIVNYMSITENSVILP